MTSGKYIRTEKHRLGLSAARKKNWADPNCTYNTEKFRESRKNVGIKNGNFNKPVSEERKLKQSITMKRITNDPNSIYQSPAHLEKMKQIRNDPNSVYATDEYKQKISKANTGKIHSVEGKLNHSLAVRGDKHPMWGKHHRQESKDKLKISSTNMWKDPNSKVNTKEFREKLRIANSGKNSPRFGTHLSNEIKLQQSNFMKNIWKDKTSIFNSTEYKEKRKRVLETLHKNRKGGPTKPELIIKNLLDINGITYKFQEYISPYSVDFIIPEKKLIIEVDGKYDHGDPRIYKPNDIIRGNKTAQEKWDYDLKRDNFLREKGFTILHFWEKEIKKETNLVEELIKCAIIQNS